MPRPRFHFAILLSVLASLAFFQVPCTAFSVEAGASIQVIVPEKPTQAERFAAQELARYLGKMARLDCQVAGEAKVAGERPRLFIGRTQKGIQALSLLPSGAVLAGDDPFVLVISGDEVVLAGAGDRGTVYAVYELLERLGCRFLLPDDEVVPALDRLTLPDTREASCPAFITREVDGSALPGTTAEQTIDWSVKNRFNKRFNLRSDLPANRRAWADRGGDCRWQWSAHNLQFIFSPADKLFQQHPEYFALYNGRRVPMGVPGRGGYGGGNLCTTNPQVIQIIADYANRWFDEHPNGTVFPIWPGDGDIRWCECDNCSALGGKNFTAGPEGSMSRRLETLVRAVASRVAAKHPDRKLLLPAYSNYIDPADASVLPDNVIVQVCNYSIYSRSPDAPGNEAAAHRLEAWAAKAPGRLAVWEYGLIGDPAVTDNQEVLLPLIERYAAAFRYFQRIGVKYYYTQSNSAYHHANPLLMWAIGKLAWNPQLDVPTLVRDYCTHAYGPAGGACAKLYLLLERQVQQSRWRPTTYGEMAVASSLVFTPEIAAQCRTLLAEAQACTGLNEAQSRRLKQFQQTVEASIGHASVQALAGLDGAAPWRLVRGKEAYLLNADGPEIDTKAFQLQVLAARDRGRFDPAFERVAFRARKRWEPLVTIARGDLSVSVVPGLGGRIIRLIDRKTGHNFFQEYPNGQSDQLDRIGQAYFAYGGYEEYVGSGFAGPGWETPFQCQVAPDGYSLQLTAELETGVGKIKLERMVELTAAAPAALRIRSRLTNLEKSPITTTLRSHPLIALGAPPANLRLYIHAASGDVITTPPEQHDGPSLQPEALWAVYNPAGGIALLHRFRSPTASAYFFADPQGRYVNLELKEKPVTLQAGHSLTLEQSFIPAAGPEQALALLGEDFGPAVLTDARQASHDATTRPVKLIGKAPPIVDGVARFDGKSFLEWADPSLRADPAGGSVELQIRLDAPAKAPQFLVSSGSVAKGWFYIVLEPSRTSPAGTKLSVLLSRGTRPFTAPGHFYARLSADLPKVEKGSWRKLEVRWRAGEGDGAMEILDDGQVLERRSNLRLYGPPIESSWVIGRNSAAAGGLATLDLRALTLRDAAGARRALLDLTSPPEIHLMPGDRQAK
jgi:hypothetical protein